MSSDFGDFFKEKRKNSNFSGDDGAIELSKRLGISRATVYNWEKSEKIPARLKWDKLNEVFGVNLESLYLNRDSITVDDVKRILKEGTEGDARRLSNEDLTELIDKTYADAKEHTRLRYWHLYNLGAYSTELARRLEKETRG